MPLQKIACVCIPFLYVGVGWNYTGNVVDICAFVSHFMQLCS